MRAGLFKMPVLFVGLLASALSPAQNVISVYQIDGSVRVYDKVDSIVCTTDNQEIHSMGRIYSLPVSEVDSVVYESFADFVTPGQEVDLGLSVKWAGWNVGASRPEEYGGYYAWGELDVKDIFYMDNYQYKDRDSREYIHLGSCISGTPFDVACAQWKGSWRMPTISECRELMIQCSWEWITYNGVDGRKITGPNGNSIFLPAAGFRYASDSSSQGFYGMYRTGTLVEDYSDNPYNLVFNNGNIDLNYNYKRIDGLTVRPVSDEKNSDTMVFTLIANSVTENSAILKGVVKTGSENSSNFSYGFVYSANPNPLFDGHKVMVGSSNKGDDYMYTLSGLKSNRVYYYCAYILMDGIYTYGEVFRFITKNKVEEYISGEAVDLGLSVKWASWNVGAGSPEEYGGYYAWGETNTKNDYSYEAYQYLDKENAGLMNIGNNICGTIYDVARAKWGDDWRMPTFDECMELLNQCHWEWTTYNGVQGQKVTGPNGNSIFLPAAGNCNAQGKFNQGKYGCYWFGTLSENHPYSLMFNNVRSYWDYNACYTGLSVRPVFGKMDLNPEVTTFDVGAVTENFAVLYGAVKGISGSFSDSRYGFVYSTDADPTQNGHDIYIGSDIDKDYTYTLTNLDANTTYYFCAYLLVDEIYHYGKIFRFTTRKIDENVPAEAIDLGLSVKWASWNVGASSPEEYGGYYAWGELEHKNNYDNDTYQYWDKDNGEYVFIGNNISGTRYDVARAKWGKGWRMPTMAECYELIEKCKWERSTCNGVNGQKVTGPNGNSIFLPAAGFRNGTGAYDQGSLGEYWSGTKDDEYDGAYELKYLLWGGHSISIGYRNYGYSVRPVAEEIMPEQTVDLGLSVKWAGWNVGANSPEEYGEYYAWGELEHKNNYDNDTYQYWDKDNGEYMFIGNNISGTRYDVARAKWGKGWRMPTKAEYQELIEKCKRERVIYNGVNGTKLTGPNGNSIFLPAAGFRDGTEAYDQGSFGEYWSGTKDEKYDGVYKLHFLFGSGHFIGSGYRNYGYSVRPVYGGMNLSPVVSTYDVSSITESSAFLHGIVESVAEFYSDFSYGFLYSADPNPTINGHEIYVGSNGDGGFTYSLSGLKDNTIYYYCAYLSVGGICLYGEVRSFTTEKDEIAVGQMVDLGLSVKWAGWNVGANRPEEYGGYYAWGELHEKSDYDRDTYQYFQQNTDNSWDEENWIFIGNNISGTQYDVARVQWGESWRMPNLAECQELVDKCTWKWVTYKGVDGQKITGPNGNCIFLPAAGFYTGTNVLNKGSYGHYWSGDFYEDRSYNAYCLYFYDSNPYWNDKERYYGRSVRPVSE